LPKLNETTSNFVQLMKTRPPGRKTSNLYNLDSENGTEATDRSSLQRPMYTTRPPARQKSPPNAVGLEMPESENPKQLSDRYRNKILDTQKKIKFIKDSKISPNKSIKFIKKPPSKKIIFEKILNTSRKLTLSNEKFKFPNSKKSSPENHLWFYLKDASEQPKSVNRIKLISKKVLQRMANEVIDL
jgi:hypothetical protein